jgi:hypothetical protein
MCRASAGACKHEGLTATVDQRVPALLEELDRYPDDRAEMVRAAWAWNLMTSPWPGVVEPARHLVVVHATGRAWAVRPCVRVWLVGLPVTGWWVRSWRVGRGGRPIR